MESLLKSNHGVLLQLVGAEWAADLQLAGFQTPILGRSFLPFLPEFPTDGRNDQKLHEVLVAWRERGGVGRASRGSSGTNNSHFFGGSDTDSDRRTADNGHRTADIGQRTSSVVRTTWGAGGRQSPKFSVHPGLPGADRLPLPVCC